jgi:hypothetical protein
MDRHSKAKPRMPAIENFTELRPVGVLEFSCTMAGDHIRGLDGTTPDQAYFTLLPIRMAA